MELWMILVAGAFLIVLGSVMWIMPSKRDRRIAKLRQHAILNGMKVKIMKYPMINLSGRVEESVMDGAAYSFPKEREGVHAGWMLIRNQHEDSEAPSGWGWYIKQEDLPIKVMTHIEQLLNKYSEQLLAISIMGGSVAVGWNEEGVFNDIDAFNDWQKELDPLLDAFLNR